MEISFYFCNQNHINQHEDYTLIFIDYAKESIFPIPCPDDGHSRSGTRD